MISVAHFQPADALRWDAFCEQSAQATLLHSRLFLSHHGARFVDRSLIASDSRGRWLAVLPAAQDPADPRQVVSHPGATFGGIVHQGEGRGGAMLDLLTAFCARYRAEGASRLLYRAVPSVYQRLPAQDDLYALWRMGARLHRRDLNCAVHLQSPYPTSEQRRRGLRRAQKAGLRIVEGNAELPELWSVLTDNLKRRHGATPLHSLAEIQDLAARFPRHITCVTARRDDRTLGGVVLFLAATTAHAQYIASSEQGHALSALDAVFDYCLQASRLQGRHWLAFGTSNEQAGRLLNEGLYRFKASFGGGGIVHDHYEIDLEQATWTSPSTTAG